MAGNPSARQALLEQLARRCETEEPHGLLDAAIYAAVFGVMDLVDTLPAYGTSLDAAVTLVPEGGFWMVTSGNSLTIPGASVAGQVGAGKTPALALCAASLRARAQEVE